MKTRTGEFTVVKPLRPFLDRGPRDVRAHHVLYKSGDLAISAWLYLPPENFEPAPRSGHPLDLPAPPGGALVVGHGGIRDIPAHYDLTLRRLAASGWTIAAPGYRGEGGSDGDVEFALGEVDDTIACRQALLSLTGIDPSRTWLLGSSHGAMASLHALAREPGADEIPGAVALSGVYDLPEWFAWMKRIGHYLLDEPYFQFLLKMGADELERRSVIRYAHKIKAPVFLLHGKSDTMVPVEQTIELSKTLEKQDGAVSRLRLDKGADHEYIWAPDRPQSVNAWSEILGFIESGGKVDS